MKPYQQTLWIIFGFSVTIMIFSGCTSISRMLTYPERLYASAQEQKLFDMADDAFYKGDYHEAEHLYSRLMEYGDSVDIRRRSMYGLACIRFIYAETCDEWQQAYDLWTAWRSLTRNVRPLPEDPAMLDPFLEKMASGSIHSVYFNPPITILSSEKQSTEPNPSDVKQDAGAGNSPEQAAQKKVILHEAKSNGDTVEKLLNAREKEIRKLKSQIVKMEIDMKNLKEQFSALEEIHQEIQEKKKGILQ